MSSSPGPVINLPTADPLGDGGQSSVDESFGPPEGVLPSRQRSPTAEAIPGSLPSTTNKKFNKLARSSTGKDAKDAKSSARGAPPAQSTTALDPLSQHILMRTNTDSANPKRTRQQPDSPVLDQEPNSELLAKQSTPTTDGNKDKKKGILFFGRLSMQRSRKKDGDESDDVSELSDQRAEGTNAPVFSSSIASGYIPHHKEPPRYIKTKAHNKKNREFDRMFLAQQLVGIPVPSIAHGIERSTSTTVPISGGKRGALETGGAIWAAEFSKDGKYLAAAGRDQVVRIWTVISTHEERRAHEEEESKDAGTGERLSAPVLRSRPVREFAGHTGEVLDLSWSKNNFLLSSSMDKTVRLWHMSRKECLCTFKHKDFVTSISFHPKDDRFFLAGSLDSTLRLWSIPDKSIAYSVQLPDLITAVAFCPDGQTSIAGLLNGLCLFYETEGLKLHTQVHVRSSRGKNAKGSKITGIQTMAIPSDHEEADVKVLITSNDSRIRVYNLRDKSLEVKFKGHENSCSQIRASFSDDAKYIICGSEDKKAFIWSTSTADSENKDKRPCESFAAHSERVTTAVFAPTKTRQLLGASGDPIYDLCNPPPVTLLSREEATASQTALSDDQQPPADSQAAAKKPEESPAYIARSTHYDGNIIVTADQMGTIKVFRQDCAFVKRRHDNWETGSTFSKKLASGGLLGRSASIMTRTTASSRGHSRQGSVSQAQVVAGSGGGTPQLASDRIISWRQAIETGKAGSVTGTPARSERSTSPSKGARTPINTSAANLASEARRQPYASSSPFPRNQPTSPTSSVHTTRTGDRPSHLEVPSLPSQPPTPSFSFRSMEDDGDDDLRLDAAGASYSFWNLSRWRGISALRNVTSANSPASSSANQRPGAGGVGSSHVRSTSDAVAQEAADLASRRKSTIANASTKMTGSRSPERRKSLGDSADAQGRGDPFLSPPGMQPQRGNSIVSKLSSDFSSEEGEEMICSRCGGKDFKVRKVGGRQRFLCGRCGKLMDDRKAE